MIDMVQLTDVVHDSVLVGAAGGWMPVGADWRAVQVCVMCVYGCMGCCFVWVFVRSEELQE